METIEELQHMYCAKDPLQKSAHGPNGWCSLNHLLMNCCTHTTTWTSVERRHEPCEAVVCIHPNSSPSCGAPLSMYPRSLGQRGGPWGAQMKGCQSL